MSSTLSASASSVRPLVQALDHFASDWEDRLNAAQDSLCLAQPDDGVLSDLSQIDASLASLEAWLSTVNNHLASEEQAVQQTENNYLKQLDDMYEQLTTIQANLQQTQAEEVTVAQEENEFAKEQQEYILMQRNENTSQMHAPNSSTSKSHDSAVSTTTTSNQHNRRKSLGAGMMTRSGGNNSHSAASLKFTMPNISDEEFENIPQYMRGRLSKDRLNSCVEEWIQLLKEKYTLLGHPVAKLNGEQLKRYTLYKDEEAELEKALATDVTTQNSNSSGTHYFLSTDDFRRSSLFQSLGATNLKAVFFALRHLNRIKNTSTASGPKYILIE